MTTFRKEPTPSELMDLSIGAKYLQLKEPLSNDIQKMIQGVENRVYVAISQGQLTPEYAMQAWYEMHSYHRLMQKFNQRIQVGVNAGENLAPSIGESNGN